MTKSVLILVSGLPATGKTTLSRGMSRHLRLPLLSKDVIKEILFDDIGHGDRKWGEKLNTPTYNLLNYFIEEELRAGQSLIVETPYDGDFPGEKYKEWQSRYGFECIQVMCYAKPEVLIERFIARIGAPDRHVGHNDKAALEDFKASIKGVGKVDPLPLRGEVYELDTTDFSQINPEIVISKLEDILASRPQSGHNRLHHRLLAKLWFGKK